MSRADPSQDIKASTRSGTELAGGESSVVSSNTRAVGSSLGLPAVVLDLRSVNEETKALIDDPAQTREKFGVIILANTAQTSNYAAQFLAFHLLDKWLGVPGQQRFDWDRRNWSLIEQEKQWVADKINYRSPIVLPLMLPLDEYAGTYTRAGYKDVTVYLDSEGVLRADRKDMTWLETITFHHVSGEHFLIHSVYHEDFGAFCPEVYDAEFRLSIEGKPWTLGIAWERAMGGEKIWFVRT
ncbi:beta-lactamase/transpeptidase-like protein [Penicillium odoratum]|uniref:beta-lactamase/transpeptidase-like protein n=1 Tax=Penicillium odoratum TaxID=1167516 RepID=UPI002548CDC5|nr:beta-lactamase/transpeptidase-like protein [Penicillium odoratum]KAJ5753288.1 beta-lactamase/transpeptidase-like protein [Penicillium odoratum]